MPQCLGFPEPCVIVPNDPWWLGSLFWVSAPCRVLGSSTELVLSYTVGCDGCYRAEKK